MAAVVESSSLQTRTERAGRAGAIALVCVVVLFPVYWMALNAIQPSDRALTYPPPLLPVGWSSDSFAQLFQNAEILHWLALSAGVAMLVVLFTLVFVVPAAYALSHVRWRGRAGFGLFLLLTQMMPGAVIIAPVLLLYRTLGWTNNLPALAVIHTAFVVPVCTWILKSSFDAIPREIVDAARVDGCTRWKALIHVVLPLTGPGLVAVCVVAFFSSWNEYLFASTLITDRTLYTGALGLGTLITQFDTPLGELLAAGLVFSVLPILFYMTVQRHVMRGLTAGAVKG